MDDRCVLLLNATYEPLQLMGARRAVTLWLASRVEVVAPRGDDLALRSPTAVVAVPSVLRLRHYVRVPVEAQIPPPSRMAILARDHHRCAYCDLRGDTIDHVVPRSRGGLHEWTNVVAACAHHNRVKGNRLLSELGWALRTEPRAPHGPFWRFQGLDEVDPAWVPYLPSPAVAA